MRHCVGMAVSIGSNVSCSLLCGDSLWQGKTLGIEVRPAAIQNLGELTDRNQLRAPRG